MVIFLSILGVDKQRNADQHRLGYYSYEKENVYRSMALDKFAYLTNVSCVSYQSVKTGSKGRFTLNVVQ